MLLSSITLCNAIVLQFTSPVFVLIISALFFGQRIRKRDVVTVLFTLIGIALCFIDGIKGGHALGNLVAVCAGMSMAVMYVYVDRLSAVDRFSGAFFGQMVTALAGLPWVFMTRPVMNVQTVSCIFILGVFQLGLSYVLYVKASRFCPPLACCLLGVIEPLLNPVWVMIFDGEIPGIASFIGGLIVIATVTLWCAFGKSGGEPVHES